MKFQQKDVWNRIFSDLPTKCQIYKEESDFGESYDACSGWWRGYRDQRRKMCIQCPIFIENIPKSRRKKLKNIR